MGADCGRTCRGRGRARERADERHARFGDHSRDPLAARFKVGAGSLRERVGLGSDAETRFFTHGAGAGDADAGGPRARLAGINM
jgi:hypothetical protein